MLQNQYLARPLAKAAIISTLSRCCTLVGVLAMVAGCAHYPPNVPKKADSKEGYYGYNQVRTNNSDEILLCLAFSGGGTRAASFSYGLLKALRDVTYEVDGKPRRLLDEVDFISSVSGGSVTAAAYAQYGDRTFEVLEPAFLKRNVEGALMWKALNPLHWPRLWSPYFSRSDLAAEYYDKILFKESTFASLATNNTPYIIINGTDIASGTRIPFTQHTFDVFSSDVDPYPLSRAVAASSAVPGVLSPITIDNFAGRYPTTQPEWVTKEHGPNAGPARMHALKLRKFFNSTNTPYLHLSDGGVSDNLGLRSYLDAIGTLEANPELMQQHEGLNKTRKVIFISVNAFVHHEKGWDKKAKTPGSIPVAGAADARTMERYSEDTLMWFEAMIERLRKLDALKDQVEFYTIELDFTKFKKDNITDYFLSLPTTFKLSDKVVDELEEAAHTLLHENVQFQKLATDLGIDLPKKP